MNARPLLFLTALVLGLSACGNKGPLVLPTKPVPVTAPAQPAGEVPVQMAPEATPPSLPEKPATPPAEPAPATDAPATDVPATDTPPSDDPTPAADGGR
ncbi:LPS translocon maturation chaperone LptM [Lysobacter silvisoli]|uniref:Sugar transporter n=1 Tax=Lysobacter silvisoli TaxID=2293254 RepID=A0A371K0D2_9GAMM|nr:lipoprotein [Lysobacter silvisoli]RDZ27376.1 sugar transporter [Lysobacter silvisoli]